MKITLVKYLIFLQIVWTASCSSSKIAQKGIHAMSHQPVDCHQAVEQIHDLESYYYHVLYSDGHSNKNIIQKLDSISEQIANTIENSTKKYPTCDEIYSYQIKKLLRQLPYSDSLISVTSNYIIEALEANPSSPELIFLKGYFLQLMDSTDKALVYFLKARQLGYHIHQLDSIIGNIRKLPELYSAFINHGAESYIRIERKPTYTYEEVPSGISSLDGTGNLKISDYFGDEYFTTNHQIPDSIFKECLNTLQTINICSLWSLDNRFADYSYVRQWHLPVYTIIVHTPSFEHKLKVYGLGTIYGENATRDALSITHVSELNQPRDTYIMNKLTQLSKMVSNLLTSKYRLDSLNHEYPKNIKPIYGSYNYLFDVRNQNFIKIGNKDFKPVWVTSINTQITGNVKANFDKNVMFRIDNKIYGIERETGKLKYNYQLDTTSYKFIFVNYANILEGKLNDSKGMIRYTSAATGKLLRIVEYNYNSKVLKTVEGEKIPTYSEDSLKEDMDNLFRYYHDKNYE